MAQASTFSGSRFSSSLSLLVRDVGLFPRHVFLVLSYGYVYATNKSKNRGSECFCWIGRTLLEAGLSESRTKTIGLILYVTTSRKRETSRVLLSSLLETQYNTSAKGHVQAYTDCHASLATDMLWTMKYTLTTDRSSQARIVLLHLLYTPH
jgi:hypothetical protein